MKPRSWIAVLLCLVFPAVVRAGGGAYSSSGFPGNYLECLEACEAAGWPQAKCENCCWPEEGGGIDLEFFDNTHAEIYVPYIGLFSNIAGTAARVEPLPILVAAWWAAATPPVRSLRHPRLLILN